MVDEKDSVYDIKSDQEKLDDLLAQGGQEDIPDEVPSMFDSHSMLRHLRNKLFTVTNSLKDTSCIYYTLCEALDDNNKIKEHSLDEIVFNIWLDNADVSVPISLVDASGKPNAIFNDVLTQISDQYVRGWQAVREIANEAAGICAQLCQQVIADELAEEIDKSNS